MDEVNSLNKVPSTKTILISLGINLLLGCTIIPLILDPDSFSFLKLLEVVYWQGMVAFTWPFLILNLIFFQILGNPPDLKTLLSILVYPIGWILLCLTLFLKKGKWVTLILLHITIIISFFIVWNSVFSGYDFMVG